MSKPVLFYGHRESPYASFSNFFPCEFELDGKKWSCSEQALMFYKSEDKSYQKKILQTKDPHTVKALGRQAKLRPDWDEIKFDLMIRILNAKFSQNKSLGRLLVSTEDRMIHEDCPDPWWGGGPNHPRGRDLLGKALRRVRDQIRSQFQEEDEDAL